MRSGFDFDFGPDKEQFEGVFDSDFEAIRLAVHEELRQVEEVLAFCRILVNGALFVHVHELFLGNLAV